MILLKCHCKREKSRKEAGKMEEEKEEENALSTSVMYTFEDEESPPNTDGSPPGMV